MNTAQLQQAIRSIYPTAMYPSSYSMNTDTSGNATIGLWNNSVGIQPTVDQLQAALDAATLKQAQSVQMDTLLAAYSAIRYGKPVSIAIGSNSVAFPTDVDTQNTITGYLVAFDATTAPSGLPLKDASGNVQQVTYAELKQLAAAIATQSISVWNQLVALEAQVNAATTVAAVQAVVWPAS